MAERVASVAVSVDARPPVTSVEVGDVAVHPAQLAARGLHYLYDFDPETAATTRARVAERIHGEGALVCTPHLPGSGFGRLHPEGAGFLWAAVGTDELAPPDRS
jgi:hypothetical protein